VSLIKLSFFRHLDVSRESRRTSKCKMTRKTLTAIVQRLVHLVSLDVSGHMMLDNCTVPHFEDAMGRPRWVTLKCPPYIQIVFQMDNDLLDLSSHSASSLAKAASILSRS